MRFCPECRGIIDEELEHCPKDGTLLVEFSDNAPTQAMQSDSLPRFQAVSAVDNHFTVVTKIGQGGWGGVYRAYQHSTKREVALKVLRPDVAHDMEARRRFHREAEAVCKLKHPNTVTVFDFGETAEGLLFLAMEYIEGRTLDAVLEEDGPLSPKRAMHITRQVARSLAEAHDKGIIHRDIKPHNIMVTAGDGDDDFVKVLDFGVAKLVGVDSGLTATGTTFGTPEYMSPEQVQSRDIDHRSDLYALGIIMYEMLSGSPPFTGKSAVTVAMSHVRQRPPPLRPAIPMPRAMAQLLKRMLLKDPLRRPQTATDIADELECLEKQLPDGPYKPTGTTEMVQQVISSVAAGWPAVLTVLAIVCAVVVALVVVKEQFVSDSNPTSVTGTVSPGPTTQTADAGAPESADEPVSRQIKARAAIDTTPTVKDIPVLLATDGADVTTGPDHGLTDPDIVPPSLLPETRKIVIATPPEVVAPPDVIVADQRVVETISSESSADSTKTTDVSIRKPDIIPEGIIWLTTNVSGAKAYSGSHKLCRLPCELSGPPGTRKTVRITRKGYHPSTLKLRFRKGRTTRHIDLKADSLSIKDGLKGPEPLSGSDGLK